MEAGQQTWDSLAGLWRRWRGHDGRPASLRPDDRISARASLFEALGAAVDHRRLFVLLPFGLIVGLVLYAALPGEPPVEVYAIGFLLAALWLGISLSRGSVDATRWAVQALALWLGFCLLPLHGLAMGTSMLATPTYGTYQGIVDEVLPGVGGQRIIVSQLVPVDGARPLDLRRARVLLPEGIVLSTGDGFEAPMRLAPVPGPVLPGTHDSQFHAYFGGVGAYGSVTGAVENIRPAEGFSFSRSVQSLRDGIGHRIDAVLAGDTAAIAKAMVVGDQSAISDQIRDVMAAAGLAHIYSISGLHLSIVAGGIYWLLRLVLASVPLLVGWPVKKIAAMGGITAAFLYLLLAGGLDNVPAFRSTIMLALIFGAVLAGRQALTMRNVAIAAIVIILVDPASVFRPSFQLSFAAVVGLIGIFELPRPLASQTPGYLRRVTNVVVATAWTSLVAGFATLLFSAYHFQQTAPLGVIGNVLALPFVSLVIMPFGVLSVLAMPFDLDMPFLLAMGWGIERMIDVATVVAGWSQGWTGNPLLAGWTLVLGLAALAWFAFLENHWRLVAPILAGLLILTFGFVSRPDILVADTTQAVAIRDGDTMALASGRTGSFAVDVWNDHYQIEIAPTHSGVRCDSLGCIVTTPDYTVAIVRSAAGFAEDCGRHDILVTRIDPPHFCRSAGQVIGPDQLAAGGVHALRWKAATGRFDVQRAIETLDRPWRVWRP
jgi:competence protein ComEC